MNLITTHTTAKHSHPGWNDSKLIRVKTWKIWGITIWTVKRDYNGFKL